MKRSQVLLAGLAGVLVIVLFSFLLFQPTRDEVAELEIQIAAEQQQQAMLSQEIVRLRAVREDAPEVEAALAAAEAIVPRDPALPSALRQLQLAADESDVVLQSVTTGRPAPAPDAASGLSVISVNVQMIGGYFQVIDFLRRVEDPAITPRGLSWANVNVARGEYPDLNIAMSGSLYAVIAGPVAPEPEPVPEADDADVDAENDTEDDS